MLSGVVTGVLTGMIARLVMKHLNVTGEKNKSR